MSWDVVLQSAASIDSDGTFDVQTHPLGPADTVRATIASVHPAVDWSDPTWGILEGDGWSIEFNTGDGPVVESIMMHIRGGGDPLPAIGVLCERAGWAAFDLSSGDWLDSKNPSPESWVDFQNFRDELREIVETRDAATLTRSRVRLENGVLIRSTSRGEERHELASLDEVNFSRGTNWASVILVFLALGLGILLKATIPIPWLGWVALVLLGFLALLFGMTVRTEIVALKSRDRNVVLLLVDLPHEVRAFRTLVEAARNAAPPATTD